MGIIADNAINGTGGEVWIDGELMAGIISLQATVEADMEDVPMAGEWVTDQKYMGYKISGTLKMWHIDSHLAQTVAEGIQKGVMPRLKVLSNLVDPMALGAERVELQGVKFNKVDIINWEANKLGDLELPFTAKAFVYRDAIPKPAA